MNIKNADRDDEIYTGKLRYKDDDYQFVFSGAQLRLIPLCEEMHLSMWKFEMKEITKGTYTWSEPQQIDEDVLIGNCYENGKQIIFLPKQGSCIYQKNSVLFIDLNAYIVCKYIRNSIDRITFNGPEINCIHPVNQAVECTFDIENVATNGVFSVTTKDFESTTTKKQSFDVGGEKVTVYFGVSRMMSTKIWEPPVTLSSSIMFELNATNDYRFILRLWYIARQFVQFLCYRKNIQFSKVELAAPCDGGKHENFAELYVLDEDRETEINTLKKGRYIKQTHIAGHEGEILSQIANDRIYLRHLPESFHSSQHINEARFVMITAAFEWEFNRLFPDGIPKNKARVEAEVEVSQKLNDLIKASTGKTKTIYKYLLKCTERSPSLSNKIEKIASDMDNLLKPFGIQLYSLNHEKLNYIEMGRRLADQRNHFAHGDLDKDFIGLSLLDLIFLQRIIYAMQLKIVGIEDKRIQQAINDLFACRIALQ